MFTSFRRIGVLALALAITACSADNAAAPTALQAPSAEPSASLLGGLLGGVTGTLTGALQLKTADGVLRTKPLPASITVKKTIGRDGGTLSIPAAGVTVVVPKGALDRSTVITMTARAGSLIAYDFAPHGITFAKPLQFKQQLKGTNVTLLQVPFLQLSYYADPSLLGKVTGLVSELVGGVFNILDWSFTAPIKHFSGYMVSCGRSLGR
jgi:hypothetical protein